MPSFRDLPEDKKAALVDFLASLKGERGSSSRAAPPPARTWAPARHIARRLRAGDVRPHRRGLRRDEHRHDGGAASPLALARGRSRPRRARHAGLGRRHGHGRSGDRARARAGRRRRLGLLRRHARAGAREGARSHLGAGRRDGAAVRRTMPSTRPRWGSARATSAICRRACARWSRVVKPGRPRGDPGDHDAAEATPIDLLLFVVRSRGAAARTLRRGLHVPAERRCKRFPGPVRARGGAGRGGLPSTSAGS